MRQGTGKRPSNTSIYNLVPALALDSTLTKNVKPDEPYALPVRRDTPASHHTEIGCGLRRGDGFYICRGIERQISIVHVISR
jgi:hypothetical protein